MTYIAEAQDTALPLGCTQEQIDALGAGDAPRCCGTCGHWLCGGIDPDGPGVCAERLDELNDALGRGEAGRVAPERVLWCARSGNDGDECGEWEECA